MFIVSEEAAAAIRTAFDHGGELSAAIELRRLFPGIIDNAKARDCARTIAAWTPLPVPPVKTGRLRSRKVQSLGSASGFGVIPAACQPLPFPGAWLAMLVIPRPKLSTAQSSSSLKFIDSGLRKPLIEISYLASGVSKRAGCCE
jgi:hypothetical protein